MTESEKLVTIAKNTDRVYQIGRESVLNPNLKHNVVDIKDNNWKYWGQKAIEFENYFRSLSDSLYIIIHGLFKTDDTKDVKDFGHMFANCDKLTIFPEINTSNGEIFDYMFYGCKSMIDAPDLDTSKGKVFRHMFSDCSAELIIPEYDTSNGEDFLGMFYGCAYLRKLPKLNTSNGTNFQQFLDGCWRLAGNYTFDTSNGTNFFAFARNCQQLTGLTMDVSNATDLTNAFRVCSKLQSLNFGGDIPVSINLLQSKSLTIDSLDQIIKKLRIYRPGDANYMKHTITLSPESWELLRDTHVYWYEPTLSPEKMSLEGFIACKGWLQA